MPIFSAGQSEHMRFMVEVMVHNFGLLCLEHEPIS